MNKLAHIFVAICLLVLAISIKADVESPTSGNAGVLTSVAVSDSATEGNQQPTRFRQSDYWKNRKPGSIFYHTYHRRHPDTRA